MEELLRSGFGALSLVLGEDALSRFKIYFEYLEQRGASMNLSSISGERDVASLHFLDCAALLGAVPINGRSVVDIGSGAGFPGLVLKIVEPSVSLTLLDSHKRRVDFLSECCGLLGLDDVLPVCSRAEEAPPSMRESFDFAVSRAVAPLRLLCELCLPFVRVGGAMLAMKGPEPSDEIRDAQGAMSALGAGLESLYFYTIPGTEIKHSVAVIRKTAFTPEKYPRRFARIKNSPL